MNLSAFWIITSFSLFSITLSSGCTSPPQQSDSTSIRKTPPRTTAAKSNLDEEVITSVKASDSVSIQQPLLSNTENQQEVLSEPPSDIHKLVSLLSPGPHGFGKPTADREAWIRLCLTKQFQKALDEAKKVG